MIKFKHFSDEDKKRFLEEFGYDKSDVEDIEFFTEQELTDKYYNKIVNSGVPEDLMPYFNIERFVEDSIAESGLFEFDIDGKAYYFEPPY